MLNDIKNNLTLKETCDAICDECNKQYSLQYFSVLSGRQKYNMDLCRSCKQKIQYANGTRTSFCDFYLIKSQEYIEVKPLKLIKNKINIQKFKRANEKFGKKFKIITENDLQIVTMKNIIKFINMGDLIFMKRYNEKFKELINKGNKGC